MKLIFKMWGKTWGKTKGLKTKTLHNQQITKGFSTRSGTTKYGFNPLYWIPIYTFKPLIYSIIWNNRNNREIISTKNVG